ncbi:hypothetical protein [Fischerella sp. PCC 9605]|uniref:hypothetical protein n=1 Tax=Fischerella sp. PCC 9605 TaxID=1173024 RepID=UPI0018CC252B|nr:hypothetical protein [Fischerella sp. PCC 9605]
MSLPTQVVLLVTRLMSLLTQVVSLRQLVSHPLPKFLCCRQPIGVVNTASGRLQELYEENDFRKTEQATR